MSNYIWNNSYNKWDFMKLSEISEIKRGIMIPKSQLKAEGIPILKTSEINDGKIDLNKISYVSDKYRQKYELYGLKEGDLVIPIIGPLKKILKVKKKDLPCLINNHLVYIRTRGGINRNFLYFVIQSPQFKYLFQKNLTGNYIKGISIKILRDMAIPYPSSLEQENIAEMLTKWDLLIEKSKILLNKLRQFKINTMRRIFSLGLKNEDLKDIKGRRMPKNWSIDEIGNLIQFYYGHKTEMKNNGDYDVYSGKKKIGSTDTYLIENHSIIISRIGNPIKINLFSDKIWVTNNAIYSKGYDNSIIILQFVFYFLNYLNLDRFTEGTTFPRLKLPILKKLQISFPNLNEQHEIVEILTSIDKKIELEEIRIEKLIKILNYLTYELLNGKELLF